MSGSTTRASDTFGNIVDWKSNIEREISLLKYRIIVLEGKHCSCQSTSKHSSEELSLDLLPTSGYHKTLEQRVQQSGYIQLVKSQKSARVQCSWLLICFAVFLYFGITQLIRADENEKSTWKPESKRYVMDYAFSEIQYEMPYFWYHFEIRNVTSEDVADNETLISNLLESVNYFNGSFSIMYESDNQWEIEEHVVEEVVGTVDGDGEGGYVWIMFRILLANPNLLKNDWYSFSRFNIPALEINDTYMTYLKIDVARVLKIAYAKWIYLEYDDDWSKFDDDELEVFTIDYSEKVTKKYSGSEEEFMESVISQTFVSTPEDVKSRIGIDAKKGDIILFIHPDLQVEHWQEFVDFGYWEWVAGMGGLFSIVSVVFFSIASCAGTLVGENASLGILPWMSKSFANKEGIELLKRDSRMSVCQ